MHVASKVQRLAHRLRVGSAGTLVLCFVSLSLTSCIVTTDPSVESNPRDPRPQDIVDKVRAIDLFPRDIRNSPTIAPNAPRSAQERVAYGDGKLPISPSTNAAEATPAATGEGYDLNFENAPVSSVAKVILGDILNVGYTIDPRVQGTVTLASGRPVPKSDILFVLENALRMSSVALVSDRTGYRLLPSTEAIGSGLTNTAAAVEAGFGISVVPLRFVSAPTVLKLLDGFGLKSNSVRADNSRNLLIIQGSGSERRSALEMVMSFDADWMRGQSVGIFPVRNSAPEPLITELEKIMDSGEGGLTQSMVKFQPIGRLNAILVVSSKPEYLATAKGWISRLDHADIESANLKVYRLRYSNARQIAGLLNEIFIGRSATSIDPSSSQIAPGSGVAVTSSQNPVLSALGMPPAGAAGGIGGTRNIVVANQNEQRMPDPASAISPGAAGTSNGGRPGIAGNIRITADPANNSILIFANKETHRIVEQTLRKIDRPILQVGIEATIAEVTLNDTLNYGVQFFLKSQNLGLAPDGGSMVNTIAGVALQRVLPGFNFILGSEASPRVVLDALHNVTTVKVLSNPSLVVLDNQPATLQVGDSVPISTGTATVLTANNTIVNTIDYRNTGIILRVVPRVNSNGHVLLDIEQEISNVSSGTGTNTTANATGASLTPTVSQRKVKSTIAVASGQTVLLAGLISETENRQRQGIPVLDQIPYIGEAFSHQTNSQARTELIIFIRPMILRDAMDAHVIADELRSKMNGRIVGTIPLAKPLLQVPVTRQ